MRKKKSFAVGYRMKKTDSAGTITVGFSIPGLRRIMQSHPHLKLERAFHREDGGPITGEEVIAWLEQMEAQGIMTTSQIE